MKPAVFLEISTWRGVSLGAEHYYGCLRVGGLEGYSKKIEVQRKMTAKEAREMNKKDGVTCYHPGSLTDRMDTQADVIAAARKILQKQFPERFVFLGSSSRRSAMSLLVWPKKFAPLAKRINAIAAEWEQIGGYEGNEARATELDKEWYDRLKAVIKAF